MAAGSKVTAATRTAVATGSWSANSTWSGGITPVCGDSVIIPAGITVQITTLLDYTACTQRMYIRVAGTMNFQTGKKLRLPCDSKVDVPSGGLISAGTGGGNSNLIDICNTTVWNAAQGNLHGPVTLTYSPLPIGLLHFSSAPGEDDITLTWLTVTELNNKFYRVDKSRDGKLFDELGRMDGAGTSTLLNSYQFIDKNPFDGIQYYRLSQSDFDGTTTVVGMIAVKFSRDVEFHFYPNPSRGELFVNVGRNYKGQTAQLVINNSSGKLVISKTVKLVETTFGVQLLQTREFLKPGNYLVSLNFPSKSFTQFLVVK
jgi:hypothetical protein